MQGCRLHEGSAERADAAPRPACWSLWLGWEGPLSCPFFKQLHSLKVPLAAAPSLLPLYFAGSCPFAATSILCFSKTCRLWLLRVVYMLVSRYVCKHSSVCQRGQGAGSQSNQQKHQESSRAKTKNGNQFRRKGSSQQQACSPEGMKWWQAWYCCKVSYTGKQRAGEPGELCHHGPGALLASPHRHHLAVPKLVAGGHRPGLPPQGDLVCRRAGGAGGGQEGEQAGGQQAVGHG